VRRTFVVSLAVAAVLALAAPAGAVTRVPFDAPARTYTVPAEVCGYEILAEERSGHPGTLTLDASGSVVGMRTRGAFDTVLSSSLGTLTYESWGTTSVTRNADGTWTMVQSGSGLAITPRDDPEGHKLVWFLGTVVSVGDFDPKTLDFWPVAQERFGEDADVCGQLVSGLKSRHD
jgi:hypothetical protein